MTIKLLKEMVKSTVRIMKGKDVEELLYRIDRDGTSINIYYSSDRLASLGGSYAGATLDEYLNLSIIVDDKFKEMPMNLASSILEHEIGHIMLGHVDYLSSLNTREQLKHNKSEKALQFEYEADKYASKRTGKDLAKALKIVLDSKTHSTKSRALMKSRIDVINQM